MFSYPIKCGFHSTSVEQTRHPFPVSESAVSSVSCSQAWSTQGKPHPCMERQQSSASLLGSERLQERQLKRWPPNNWLLSEGKACGSWQSRVREGGGVRDDERWVHTTACLWTTKSILLFLGFWGTTPSSFPPIWVCISGLVLPHLPLLTHTTGGTHGGSQTFCRPHYSCPSLRLCPHLTFHAWFTVTRLHFYSEPFLKYQAICPISWRSADGPQGLEFKSWVSGMVQCATCSHLTTYHTLCLVDFLFFQIHMVLFNFRAFAHGVPYLYAIPVFLLYL